MAGFQVAINGRFWVATEVIGGFGAGVGIGEGVADRGAAGATGIADVGGETGVGVNVGTLE